LFFGLSSVAGVGAALLGTSRSDSIDCLRLRVLAGDRVVDGVSADIGAGPSGLMKAPAAA